MKILGFVSNYVTDLKYIEEKQKSNTAFMFMILLILLFLFLNI
jgi:hypothetical protein